MYSRQQICKVTCVAALVTASTGCAGVRIYSDPELKTQTGVRHYAPKPYLLVTRTGAKEKPVELSVVYLPNLEEPHFAIMKGGLGNNKMNLKLTNGILTEFGTE